MKDILEENIKGQSAPIKKVIKTIRIHAKFPTPTLITGETGTGKELAARGLHYAGSFSANPFIPVNCSTFSDELFVSELFGYKKGAFTDAKNDHSGLLAAAEGGTLFLDEIDSLSLKSQAALLRVLQEKEYRPIGSNTIQTANSRLIAATNHNLPDLINDGLFREDLYYRLLILNIHMPPLRERSEDIETLITSFIVNLNKEYGLECKGVSPQVLELLCQHSWPGNVRELENTIHRLYLTTEGNWIETVGDMQLESGSTGTMPQMNAIQSAQSAVETDLTFSEAKRKAIEAFEHTYVRQVLDVTHGNVTKAASLCGKERRAFGKLVKKYKINKEHCEHY